MNLVNAVQTKRSQITRKLQHLKFAMSGKSTGDKYRSYLLRLALERPFEERPPLIKDRIFRGLNNILVRHKYFNNMAIEFDLSDNFQMAICQEFFLDNVYDFTRLRFEPEQVVDCGGYRGYFTFLAARHFPNANIICIESHPDNYKRIQQTIITNKLDKRVSVLHRAVSASNTPVHLRYDGTNSIVKSRDEPQSEIEIETVHLQNFIGGNNLLLKVDIEGSELDFFPAIISQLPSTCAIFLETHDGWNNLDEIRNCFIQHGFSFDPFRERDQFIDSFAQRC